MLTDQLHCFASSVYESSPAVLLTVLMEAESSTLEQCEQIDKREMQHRASGASSGQPGRSRCTFVSKS
jgi:hypothetical protein